MVLEYLALCRNVWKGREADLDAWTAEIRTGATPRLGQLSYSALLSAATGPFGTGAAAPGFQVKDLQGNEQALEAYKGKVVLLNFWTTWCGPCRTEMPVYEKLHREFAGKDVAVLAVNVDEPRETVAEFISKENYSLPVLLTKGSDVATQYAVRAFPTLIAVDVKGLVAEVVVGGRSEGELRQTIESARAGAPSPVPAPQTAEDYFRSGIGLLHQRKLTEGAAALTRAIELRKNWTQARLSRAQAWYELKRYDDSIADLNEAIRLKPDSASVYNRRGLAYSYSGRHEQAIPDYTKAIALQPDMAMAYNNRGWAHLELGHHEEALADLNRALDLEPAHNLALENRTRLYIALKRYEEAIADGYSLLRLHPNSRFARERLAEAQRLVDSPTPILGMPVLLSPVEGTVFDTYPRDTLLKWSPVTDASGYQVEIDFFSNEHWVSDSASKPDVRSTSKPEYRFNFVGAQPGRWRVWAIAPGGQSGPKSAWRGFRYTR